MMDKSPDRFGSVSISKECLTIRAGCSDCQHLREQGIKSRARLSRSIASEVGRIYIDSMPPRIIALTQLPGEYYN